MKVDSLYYSLILGLLRSHASLTLKPRSSNRNSLFLIYAIFQANHSISFHGPVDICISNPTICPILSSAQNYWRTTSTKYEYFVPCLGLLRSEPNTIMLRLDYGSAPRPFVYLLKVFWPICWPPFTCGWVLFEIWGLTGV